MVNNITQSTLLYSWFNILIWFGKPMKTRWTENLMKTQCSCIHHEYIDAVCIFFFKFNIDVRFVKRPFRYHNMKTTRVHHSICSRKWTNGLSKYCNMQVFKMQIQLRLATCNFAISVHVKTIAHYFEETYFCTVWSWFMNECNTRSSENSEIQIDKKIWKGIGMHRTCVTHG